MVKDVRKIYEFFDVVVEVEFVKENLKYKILLVYYDLFYGVNLFVCKFFGFFQLKWIDRVLKYKVEYNVLYLLFIVFIKFLKEMSVCMNDLSFVFDKGFLLLFDNREKIMIVRGQIIINKMKLI